MGERLDLQDILELILGTPNVYYQPPSSMNLVYPCIVYRKKKIETKQADNINYKLDKVYTVTVIDKDPDSIIPDQILTLPRCVSERSFVYDNLNHDVFVLIF
jgi:hypothetical protein